MGTDVSHPPKSTGRPGIQIVITGGSLDVDEGRSDREIDELEKSSVSSIRVLIRIRAHLVGLVVIVESVVVDSQPPRKIGRPGIQA